MASRQLALVLITVTMAYFLSGCGQNSTPPAITVIFTPAFMPPTSLIVSEQCGIAATITNDPTNKVNWSVTCGGADCGGFTPTQTASTVPTTYTAPPSIPTGDTVTITATSVTDSTKFASSSPIPVTQNTSSGCVQP